MSVSSGRQIFRQAALDRLSSPEQLDRLVRVSDPVGWLALGIVAFLLTAIVAWGIWGKIPDQVDGKGILVSAGGRVIDAMSPSDGTITTLFVHQNDEVEKDQEIAIIEQSALRQEYEGAQETLREREAEKRQIVETFKREFKLKQGNFAEQAAAQRQIIAAARERATYLKTAIAGRESLVAKGILPRDKVEELRTDYNKVLQDISAAKNRILELESETLTLQSDNAKDVTRIDQEIADAARAIREKEISLKRNGRVVAPASGRLVELKVFEGAVIQTGSPIASIATEGSALQAVLYIPTKDGKRIQPGMEVRVSPSSVKKEEHGNIVGTIVQVSEFPVSKPGMLSVLQNERLVAEYSDEGAPYEVRVDLHADPNTVSGFKWTSGTGADVAITSGTTVEAEVTVAENPPASLIVPFVRKHTGIGFWPASASR